MQPNTFWLDLRLASKENIRITNMAKRVLGPREKPTTTILISGHNIKMNHMAYYYTHKLVCLITHIKETSFCGGQLTQRPTTGQCSGNKNHHSAQT